MHVYCAENIRKIDQQAEQLGFSMFTLMENAGRGITEALMKITQKNEHILILAGRGNNGGDGIVAARYLKNAGYKVSLVLPLGNPKTETAQAHLNYYRQQGFTSVPLDSFYHASDGDLLKEFADNVSASGLVTNSKANQPAIIVDALLGIGAQLPLRKSVATIVEWANNQQALRYAIDIPTGVKAEEGTVETAGFVTAFQAAATFVLHGAKPSAFLHPSSRYYGKVIPITIGLLQKSAIKQTTEDEVRTNMPKRASNAHKGSFGTSVIIAGTDNMPGSALLAATGAIRTGTGRLTIGTTSFVASIIATQVPEATYILEGISAVIQGELPPKTTAVGIGPGLTDTKQIGKALHYLIKTDIPVVVDAGALLPEINWQREAPTVLTPHPGEFSKLTGIPIASIEANRLNTARDYAEQNNVILVLKGQHTIIAFPNSQVRINPTGNSGLSKGGSGDVLTGMITSMISYYESPEAAVMNAVYLHGLCAEYWAEKFSESAMTASDFAQILPKVLQQMES